MLHNPHPYRPTHRRRPGLAKCETLPVVAKIDFLDFVDSLQRIRNMLTLFTALRPFTDVHAALIQRNAIGSWVALEPTPQIVLMGDDAGVAEVAQEFGLLHLPGVETNEKGVPMRSSMCQLARRVAEHELMCIINGDIIILDGFYEALQRVRLKQFVAAGRRYNLDIHDAVDFHDADWSAKLQNRLDQEGELFGPSAIDYVVYSRNISPPVLPPFPMADGDWDPWFLFQHQQQGIPVVNLNHVVTVIHQNHETPEDAKRKRRKWYRSAEGKTTVRQTGGFSSMITLREADYVMTSNGLERPPLPYRLLSRLARYQTWRNALACKRQLQAWLY